MSESTNTPTVVLVHGGFADASYWAPVIEDLQAHDLPVLAPPNTTNPSFSPAGAGTYRWIASYDGDANNAAVAGTCGSSGQTSVVTQPSSAGPGPRTCKSLRRKLRFSKQRLGAAVHEVSRERLSQRITRLRQMIKARRCT